MIRYDHRDIGLSTKTDRSAADGSVTRGSRATCRPQQPSAYTLVDMAEDAKGVLDHLAIDRAHVVGASMGGMIAQILAGSHPDRVASLALLMTSSGKPLSALPRWRVIRLAFDPPGQGRADGGQARLRGPQHRGDQRPELPADATSSCATASRR